MGLLVLAIPFGPDLLRRTRRSAINVSVALGVLAVLPILVVLYEVARIVQRGELVYDTHVKTGGGSITVFAHALRVMQPSTHSFAGFVLLGMVGLGIAIELRRDRVDWVQLALLALAFASLEMSVQTNVYVSRYYLPTLALLAVGAARTVSAFPVYYRRGVIAVALGLGLASSIQAHSTVRHWAAGDQSGEDLVASVRASTHRGCRLTISGVDYERTKAIAALVAYPHGHLSCAGLSRYVLIGPGQRSGLPEEICAPAGNQSRSVVGTSVTQSEFACFAVQPARARINSHRRSCRAFGRRRGGVV